MAVLGPNDNIDNEPLEALLPSHGEALQAMLLLCRYTKGLNDPVAHTVETTLGSFTQRICMEEMQNMKDTKITSYFTHK